MQMQYYPVVLLANETVRGNTVPHIWGGEKQDMRLPMWLCAHVTHAPLCYFCLKMVRSEPKKCRRDVIWSDNVYLWPNKCI